MKKTQILLLILLVAFFESYSQTILKGQILDELNKAIPYGSILLKNTSDASIIAYSFTKEDGSYTLKTLETGNFILIFSALGYRTKTTELAISDSSSEIITNVILIEEAFALNEVIVSSEKPITISNDTINFKTNFFTNGTEQNVEDLLKKIPGLSVDSQGTIKVGNQEIEKLMVDGDDLFERGYKVLSKNMPAYPIEEVEILKNYSNNRLLKGIEESNKVALNLKLNEKSKRIWFGNFTLGYGLVSENRYELKGNLMNFGKKNKYYFLTNLNNTGSDAIGDVQNLVRPFRFNEPGVIGDNVSITNLIGLNGGISNFKRERSNFNNAELLSLNAIFSPTEKLKIKTLAFLNTDETIFFRNATETVNVNTIDFTNSEDFKLRNKTILGFGKLDFNYTISKTKSLEATTKYNSGNDHNSANLVFNGLSTIQSLKNNNTLFDQKITYSNKFKDKKVFLLTARYIQEESPQNYVVNQFLFEELFTSSTNANNVKQFIENKMQYIGINAHLLDRRENDDLVEIQVGNEYCNDKLNTAFELFEDDNSLDFPLGYQNQIQYRVNDVYVKSKYRLKINDFALSGILDLHQLYNSLDNNENNKSETPFFINPSFGAEWKINGKNKLITTYSYNTTNAKILDLHDNYVLTSFRSFQKGLNTFNQLNNSSVVLNYELGNWSDRFFANTFMMYSKNHDFFSSNTFLNQNYTLSDKIRIEDREFLSINSKIDYYFKAISSNLKLDVGYSKSNYKNSINNAALREVKTANFNYGLELRSGFRGFFNYHLGTKWLTNTIETTISNNFTDNTSFLDLSFLFDKKLDIQLQSERYYFGNLTTDNTYYFLDFDARYKMPEQNVTITLTGKNLFNTETFRQVSISDIGSATTEFRLLPRFVLLKLEYRF
ncbi:carboxypeptidase-like regulatory domain-containing protein [Cellulophaga tyrosinoxydans]|uniref:Outer membrane protein beta-barrel family protein n=1 Tax=Cellulophaga tyrosinoxydans TaxID=504486 RepID=A0A1W1YHS8_9FLAO|nr:carboxypeptidase-like regulatory domain-containing protein [Cellulophaga tyrosinoxydans]SMC35676.1 Outer membrane protein beta-barrel family protein [Cellulophaga tyrosinoxydans]